MRVGIDAHMVGGHETGNETYVKGLVEAFKDRPGALDVVVYNVGQPWTAPTDHVRFDRLLAANPYARLGAELPLRSLVQRLDVLHVTYSAPLWSAAPLVVTVHDICFVTNPEWFSPRDLRVLNANVPRSIRHAAQVITVSNDARARIMETYRVPESRIVAIPNGAGPAAQAISIEEARAELLALGLKLQRPYLLAVGNLQPRKNLVRLVQAFTSGVAPINDVDLIIVGPHHYQAEVVFNAAAAMPDRIRFTGYVTDRQLAALYTCSAAFVFPSLYEGFGLPAIEAMSHGIPCACSNAGALPEVCGEAALFFDPYSIEAISDSMVRLLDDDGLRRRLSAAGLARAREFTWAKSAELTVSAYERAQA